jgi:hypothetical protein
MGILEYLLGRKVREPDGGHQPRPSKGGAGPNIDEGRHTTKTEMDLRRVQGQYDPETESFRERGER